MVSMTDREESRRPRRNEDEPEVEGHYLRQGPEDPQEAGRVAQMNEDADEGADDAEKRPR